MLINRNNYEEFFIRYADGELSRAEKAAVENFLEACPDLQAELDNFRLATATPEEDIVFENRASLKRTAGEPDLSVANFDEWITLYHDGELTAVERTAVDKFAQRNAVFQGRLVAGEQLLAQPDLQVVCPNRESLYRTAAARPVYALFFRRGMAAAVMLMVLMAGLLYYRGTLRKNPVEQPQVAVHPIQPGDPGVNAGAGLNTHRRPMNPSPAIDNAARVALATTEPANRAQAHRAIVQRPVLTKQQATAKPAAPPEKEQAPEPAPPEMVALNLNPARIDPGNSSRTVTVAAPGPDQPMLLKEPVQATFAANHEPDEEGHLIPGVAKAEHAIRNLLQRTSATIRKKHPLREGDGNQKTILVGSFEFALN